MRHGDSTEAETRNRVIGLRECPPGAGYGDVASTGADASARSMPPSSMATIDLRQLERHFDKSHIRIRQICAAREVTIVRGAISSNHIHILAAATLN